MSRAYAMTVIIDEYNPKKFDDIKNNIDCVWGMSNDWEQDGGHCFSGEGGLTMGIDEEEFSQLIRDAVWKANGGYCEVEVRCTCLDDLPTDCYSFDEDDYEKWKETKDEKQQAP